MQYASTMYCPCSVLFCKIMLMHGNMELSRPVPMYSTITCIIVVHVLMVVSQWYNNVSDLILARYQVQCSMTNNRLMHVYPWTYCCCTVQPRLSKINSFGQLQNSSVQISKKVGSSNFRVLYSIDVRLINHAHPVSYSVNHRLTKHFYVSSHFG